MGTTAVSSNSDQLRVPLKVLVQRFLVHERNELSESRAVDADKLTAKLR